MGKPWASHCGCPSAEQIVQTVHSPSPILSPVHCLCPCISFWLGKIALRASEQTVQKRASYLLPFPGELAFLFQLQAVKGLESLCQDPELIALSLGADAGVFITKCSVKCFLANYAATPTPTHPLQPSPLRSLQTFGSWYIQGEFLQHKWCAWLLWQHNGVSGDGLQHGCRGFGGTKANSELLHTCCLGSLAP